MTKIAEHKEFLNTLRTMINKQANGPTATGKPGADTHFTAVDPKHDKVDKNNQGRPEKNPQDVSQKPATDSSEPSKPKHAEETPAAVETKEAQAKTSQMPDTAKSEKAAEAPAKVEQKIATETEKVEEKQAAAPAPEAKVEEKQAATPVPDANTKLAALATDLQNMLAEMQKQANGPTATGKPGADTHFTAVDAKHDTVDKNKQGRPEKNPQEVSQKPATDSSEPSKPKHAEEEVEKLASFELGRQFARAMWKTAQENVQAQVKTAGRRDFEQLIAQAAAELEQQESEKQGAALFDELYTNEKQAEEAGAQAFNELYKLAQYEYALGIAKQAEEQLNVKLAAEQAAREAAEKRAAAVAAALAEKEAALNEKIAAEKRAAEMNAWANVIMDGVVDRLQREARTTN